jgi:hypothetical protein
MSLAKAATPREFNAKAIDEFRADEGHAGRHVRRPRSRMISRTSTNRFKGGSQDSCFSGAIQPSSSASASNNPVLLFSWRGP